MFNALPRLGAALVRHLVAYSDLVGDEARLALPVLTQRLVGLVLAIAAGGLATLLACVWVIALTWDGPYRSWAIAMMWAAFTGLAAMLWLGNRPGARTGKPPPFARLRAEWEEDRKILVAKFAHYPEDAAHDGS